MPRVGDFSLSLLPGCFTSEATGAKACAEQAWLICCRFLGLVVCLSIRGFFVAVLYLRGRPSMAGKHRFKNGACISTPCLLDELTSLAVGPFGNMLAWI